MADIGASEVGQTAEKAELAVEKLSSEQRKVYNETWSLAKQIMGTSLPWAGSADFQKQADQLKVLQNEYKSRGLDPNAVMEFKGLPSAIKNADANVTHYSVARPGGDLNKAEAFRQKRDSLEERKFNLEKQIDQSHLAYAVKSKSA